MAEPAGMPNWFERGREVWSVATVTNGMPPCACAGEQRSSANPLATRHMQIILHAGVRRFWNRDECGDRYFCIGTPSPRVKIRGSEHGYYHSLWEALQEPRSLSWGQVSANQVIRVERGKGKPEVVI